MLNPGDRSAVSVPQHPAQPRFHFVFICQCDSSSIQKCPDRHLLLIEQVLSGASVTGEINNCLPVENVIIRKSQCVQKFLFRFLNRLSFWREISFFRQHFDASGRFGRKTSDLCLYDFHVSQIISCCQAEQDSEQNSCHFLTYPVKTRHRRFIVCFRLFSEQFREHQIQPVAGIFFRSRLACRHVIRCCLRCLCHIGRSLFGNADFRCFLFSLGIRKICRRIQSPCFQVLSLFPL